jgi:hypothetical protein
MLEYYDIDTKILRIHDSYNYEINNIPQDTLEIIFGNSFNQ